MAELNNNGNRSASNKNIYMQSDGNMVDTQAILNNALKQYDPNFETPTYATKQDRYITGVGEAINNDKANYSGDVVDAKETYRFAAQQAKMSDDQINNTISSVDASTTKQADYNTLNSSQFTYSDDERNAWTHTANDADHTGYGNMSEQQHQAVADNDLNHLTQVELSNKNAFKYDEKMNGKTEDQANQDLQTLTSGTDKDIAKGSSNAASYNDSVYGKSDNAADSSTGNSERNRHEAKAHKKTHHKAEAAAVALGAGYAAHKIKNHHKEKNEYKATHHEEHHKSHHEEKHRTRGEHRKIGTNHRGRSKGATIHKVFHDVKKLHKESEYNKAKSMVKSGLAKPKAKAAERER